MPRWLVPALALSLVVAACGEVDGLGARGGEVEEAPAPSPAPARDDEDDLAESLEVVSLDVGQGDATLVRSQETELLVDTGRHDRDGLADRLDARGVEELEALAVTHPHADHIGQFPEVVDAVEVDEVWWNPADHDTATFDRALEALEASQAAYAEPQAGDVYDVGGLVVEFVNPDAAADDGDLHDSSLAFRVRGDAASVLFTGDAERETERRLAGGDHAEWLDAQLYQLGHHGSATSTSPALLEQVDPKLALGSYAEHNQYGHPHEEVVERLDAAGVELYGTGTHGTVTATHDGNGWTVDVDQHDELDAHDVNARDRDEADPSEPGCVDLNTATVEELEAIQHIGPQRGAAIVDQRPWSSVGDLDEVNGLGAARLADIREQGVACVP